MAVIEGEEPIVSRVDRLDHMLRHLEEMRGCNYSSKNNNRATISPPRSSGASSTASSETLKSEGGQNSSLDDWSPRSLEKYCRPIDMVMMETQVKGNLIDRLVQVEDRVLKLCIQMEQGEREIVAATKMTPKNSSNTNTGDHEDDDDDEEKRSSGGHHPKKKGLKQLVKSFARAGKSSTSTNKAKKHHWI